MVDQVLEAVDKPVAAFFNRVAHNIAAKSDERVRWWTSLHVGGAVADHDHVLVVVSFLQQLDHSAFSARLGRQFFLVEAIVITFFR